MDEGFAGLKADLVKLKESFTSRYCPVTPRANQTGTAMSHAFAPCSWLLTMPFPVSALPSRSLKNASRDAAAGNAASLAAIAGVHAAAEAAATAAAEAQAAATAAAAGAASTGSAADVAAAAAAAVREVTAELAMGVAGLSASFEAGQRADTEALALELATQRSLLLRDLRAASEGDAAAAAAAAGAALAELQACVEAVREAVDEGFSDVARRLVSLAASVDGGFLEVAGAVAAEGLEARRAAAEGLAELSQQVGGAVAKFEGLGGAASASALTGKQVQRLLRDELGLVANRLEDLADGSAAAAAGAAGVQAAVEDLKGDLTAAAKAAKDDAAALGAVVGEAKAAMGLLAGEVAALRGDVAALSRDWAGLAADLRTSEDRDGAVRALQAALDPAALDPASQAAGGGLAELLERHQGAVLGALQAVAAAAAGSAAAAVKADVEAMYEDLKNGQEGSAEVLAAALDDLAEHVGAVEEQASRISGAMGTQLRLLDTLLANEDSCPALVTFFKKPRKHGFAAAARNAARQAATLGSAHFKLAPLCECCLGKRGGPHGAGYTTLMASKLLRAVAPVLALALKLFIVAGAVALRAASAGVVDARAPGGGGGPSDTTAETFDFVSSLIAPETLADINEAADALLAGPTATGSGGGVGNLTGRMKRATGDAYKQLEKELRRLDPKFAHLGLERVMGGGGEAGTLAKRWVCAACKPGFEKEGTAFKPAATAVAKGSTL